MKGRRGLYRPRRPRRLPAWLRAAGWLALVLASLFTVTWRQTRGLELETQLRELETQRDLADAERIEHVRRIETLRSRARVVRVARERLGMRLAVGEEIVFLSAAASAPAVPLDGAVAEGPTVASTISLISPEEGR